MLDRVRPSRSDPSAFRRLAAGAICWLAATCGGACAAEPATPAVIVLSGSKGFGSPADAGIAAALEHVGIDAVALHVLTEADIDALARAGGAKARIAYEATRMPRWIEAVRTTVNRLGTDARHGGRVGILGISLGAQIAAAAAADPGNVRALVLVDGGFPSGSGPPRTLPPLSLIWGGVDRVFPVATARKLLAAAQGLGGEAGLKVYEGGAHDFFLQPASPQARSAWRDAATFFASRLK